MQNFKSSTATVIELCFMKKKKIEEDEDEEDEESVKIYLYFIPHVTVSSMKLRFYMFSTLMSSEDRLRLKLKVFPYVWL